MLNGPTDFILKDDFILNYLNINETSTTFIEKTKHKLDASTIWQINLSQTSTVH